MKVKNYLYFKILFAFLFLNLSAQVHSIPTYISLGEDCQAALTLRTLDRRFAAYPLDWVVTYDFNKVIKAFKEDFAHFVDPIYLSLSSPYLPGLTVHNSYYSLCFIHDFPTLQNRHLEQESTGGGEILQNFLDYVPPIEEKYNNRIQRLINVLNSQEPIVFIRTVTLRTLIPFRNDFKINQAKRFVNVIKDKYPSLPFLLVIIHNDINLNYNWNLKNIFNYYHPYPFDWVGIDTWKILFEKFETEYFNCSKNQ